MVVFLVPNLHIIRNPTKDIINEERRTLLKNERTPKKYFKILQFTNLFLKQDCDYCCYVVLEKDTFFDVFLLCGKLLHEI